MEQPEWKPRTGQPIEKLYAWIATEPDGGEGVVACEVPVLGFTPLVGADRARMESFREYAQAVGRLSGCPVHLKLFSGGIVIDGAER